MAKVNWEMVDDFVEQLAEYIEYEEMSFSGVYGLPRGGLVLAVMLSYRLRIPLLMAPARDCLIVDDIADTGRSLMHYTKNETQHNKYFIATMFFSERSLVVPDFWAFGKKKDDWVVFPWEETKFLEGLKKNKEKKA